MTTYATLFAEDPAGLMGPPDFYESDSALFTPELYDVIHETVWQAVRGDSLQFQGDYNGNSLVEAGDLSLVLLNWAEDSRLAPIDWKFDLPRGLIDFEELDRVLLNWGRKYTPLIGSAVPEPSSAGLLLVLAALALKPLLLSSPASGSVGCLR